MKLNPFVTIEDNRLKMNGVELTEMAKKYGTPLMVYNDESVRNNCRNYVKAVKEHCKSGGKAIFASKAFSCLEMCRICNQEGMGLDVVSGGELYTALKAGFPAGNIWFHGNNKSYDELVFALKNGVGRIVVDNYEELKTLSLIAQELETVANIYFRIKPGVDAHTHDFIKTGQIDSKFGFTLENGEAMAAVKTAIDTENVNLAGLHCHIGSQIFDVEPFVHAAEVMMDFISTIKKETSLEIKELDLGGGFGIMYTENDNPLAPVNYIAAAASAVSAKSLEYGISEPYLVFEPGRSLVGAEALTLYTVGSVKEIPGIRTYVAVDGGMTDNPRYMMYGAEYTVLNISNLNSGDEREVAIAGKCCESGDLVQGKSIIDVAKAGDILAVMGTGAYNYSMSSNYNRNLRPEVVMIDKTGASRTIIKRETFDDLIKNDI